MTAFRAYRQFALTLALFATAAARAGSNIVDLHPGAWEADPGAVLSFSTPAEAPLGALTVHHGGAVLRGMGFTDGTIDFDVREEPDNQGIPGLWFHRRDAQVAENVYLRIDSDCPRSVECLQYAPVAHGNVQWDVFPQFQAGAPVHATGWNHVRLVISGQRLDVFINSERKPSLSVGRLEGDAASGGLEVWGDATYANFVLDPGSTGGLDPLPAPDPTAEDPTLLREWRLSPVGQLARGQAVSLEDEPASTNAWPAISAERKGFVNLGRDHGTTRGTPDLAWLHATVESDHDQVRRVSLGWAREVWIFVNGKPAFVSTNAYYPSSARRGLGRMALDNGSFNLPLRAGHNDIEVAISDDLQSSRHWGWGFIWKFDQVAGLKFPATVAGM
jgi:hypothetical protein